MSNTMDCGHGCKVTCPDGGGCVYNETTGVCCTVCNGEDIDCGEKKDTFKRIVENLKNGGKININLRDMSLNDLTVFMERLGVK